MQACVYNNVKVEVKCESQQGGIIQTQGVEVCYIHKIADICRFNQLTFYSWVKVWMISETTASLYMGADYT